MAGVTEYLVTLLKTPPFNHFCHSHLSVAQMRIQSDHSFSTSALQLECGRIPSRRVKLCPLLVVLVPSYPTRPVWKHLYKSILYQAVRFPSRLDHCCTSIRLSVFMLCNFTGRRSLFCYIQTRYQLEEVRDVRGRMLWRVLVG